VRLAPTRFPSSSLVIASFVRLERSEITAAVEFANAQSSDGSSHRGRIQSESAKPIESQRPRLNRKIDIVGAVNIVSSRRLRMDKSPLDYAGFRHEYIGGGLRRTDLDPDPVKQFHAWFAAAIKSGIHDANAMTLATCVDEKPSARVVLLKDFDERGFVFFTNYASDKGRQLEKNPNASLLMYWMEVERQIRIEGKVEKTSREESEQYFHSRPIGAQLGAWASHQSQVIDGRRVLNARLEEMKQRFAEGQVPLPPHWGGYRLAPDRMEFWQGRPDRLHDRFRYTLQSSGSWSIDRLAP
jgi:pyridoxamine 5'-phosphate oxidase